MTQHESIGGFPSYRQYFYIRVPFPLECNTYYPIGTIFSSGEVFSPLTVLGRHEGYTSCDYMINTSNEVAFYAMYISFINAF
jgi:hypothetical protein